MNDYKQVIVVRTDLKLSKGKIAVQVAHAAVTLVLNILKANNKLWIKWLNEWLEEGQKKIVLKVKDLNELLDLYNAALKEGLPAVIIRDAGLTEVPPNTITCIGIGPAPAELIDKITGGLKLL